jgi:hypothetical protein
MDTLDLEEIKRWLEHGDMKRIADKLEIDKSYVSYTLAGKARKPNLDIVNAAIEKAIERKSKILNGMSRLKQLQ